MENLCKSADCRAALALVYLWMISEAFFAWFAYFAVFVVGRSLLRLAADSDPVALDDP
jgi:bacteriorhodopsin